MMEKKLQTLPFNKAIWSCETSVCFFFNSMNAQRRNCFLLISLRMRIIKYGGINARCVSNKLLFMHKRRARCLDNTSFIFIDVLSVFYNSPGIVALYKKCKKHMRPAKKKLQVNVSDFRWLNMCRWMGNFTLFMFTALYPSRIWDTPEKSRFQVTEVTTYLSHYKCHNIRKKCVGKMWNLKHHLSNHVESYLFVGNLSHPFKWI